MIGNHAIVLGGSMAGLLAARTLADFYTTVTVIERDTVDESALVRRGVPQGRHTHGLLMRGAMALEELFPGFLDQLVERGAVLNDGTDLSRLHFCMNGHVAVHSGTAPAFRAYNMTRPFLERHVRGRVVDLPNVSVLGGREAVDLCLTEAGRVCGVCVVDRTDNVAAEWPADLVVDATGRGSRTPALLERNGFAAPTDDEVRVDLLYASQLLRPPEAAVREYGLIVSPVPGRPTGVALAACENDTVFFTVFGMAGRHPPLDLEGMCKFVSAVTPPHILAAVRSAEPVSPVAQHRFPSSRWRRYDKLPRLPEGLVVVGDAVCSFNPIYAQGMTVAAMEALVLRDCLSHGEKDLPRRFFRAAAKPIRQAWQMAAGGDLSLPEIAGTPPLATRLLNGYLDRVLAAAEQDIDVFEQFIKVAWLVDQPSRLLRPGMIRRIAFRRRGVRLPEPAVPVRLG
ncbi:2-polyprenyl-6-methoxyphenol hydroxylase-like oxidoreductase [Mycobacterium sp. SVM_VP21]|nr:2-polyprenyl-6-methoxyphenol hydroxylase-like oxidoreductase [Mycobacterium sp. SVM_VP21]